MIRPSIESQRLKKSLPRVTVMTALVSSASSASDCRGALSWFIAEGLARELPVRDAFHPGVEREDPTGKRLFRELRVQEPVPHRRDIKNVEISAAEDAARNTAAWQLDHPVDRAVGRPADDRSAVPPCVPKKTFAV